jgi:hypothetical protein
MTSAVDARLLREHLAAGAQLVEVLPEAGYREEHLPAAINIPLKQLDATTAQQLDPRRAVVVYRLYGGAGTTPVRVALWRERRGGVRGRALGVSLSASDSARRGSDRRGVTPARPSYWADSLAP